MSPSSFLLLLVSIEDALWRMIAGVFRFVFHKLPYWAYKALVETIGPVTLRLIRVAILLGVWLAIVFGPMVLTAVLTVTVWWDLSDIGWSGSTFVGSTVWSALALFGSVWGFYCIVRKRKIPVLEPVGPDVHACNGLTPRRALVGPS